MVHNKINAQYSTCTILKLLKIAPLCFVPKVTVYRDLHDERVLCAHLPLWGVWLLRLPAKVSTPPATVHD